MRKFFVWMLSLGLTSLHATMWTVNTTTDTASGTGTSGSLRYCVDNALSGDTINFGIGGSSGTITLSGTGSLLALDITQASLTIENTSGTTIYINGNNAVPVFYVADGANLNLSGVTLIDGRAQGGSGGAGPASSGTPDGGAGGGGAGLGGALFIDDGGSATISTVSFISNTAQGGNGGSAGSGTESGTGGGGGAGGASGSNGFEPPAGGGGGGGGGGWGLGNGGGGGGQYNGSPGPSGGTGGSGDGGSGGTADAAATDPTGGGGGGGASPFATNATGGGFGGGGGGGGSTTNGEGGGFGGGGGGAESGTVGSGGFGGGTGAMPQGGGGAAFGGAIFVRQGGSVTLGNSVSFSGNNVSAGSGGGGSAGSGSSDGQDLYINSGSTLTFDPSSNVSFSSEIAGDTQNSGGGVVLDASSSSVQVSLSATNDYGGSTTITQGILSVGSDSNLGASTTSLVLNGGTLLVNSGFTLGSSRAVSTTSSTSGISVDNDTSLTINQNITGSGAITVTSNGGGVLVLGGTNNYTGGTTLTSGTLNIATDRGLGGTSGALTLNGGVLYVTGTITLSGSRTVTTSSASSAISIPTGSSLTINQAISGSGGLTMICDGNEDGILVLGGSPGNGFTGGFTIDSGIVSVAADNQLGGSSGFLTLNGGTLEVTNTFTLSSSRTVELSNANGTSSFDIASGKTLTVSQAIADGGSTGGLILSGTGQLTLEGNSTYSGTTTISAGTLALSGSGQISSSQGVTIDSGATFDITAATQNVSIKTLAGSGTINAEFLSGPYNLEIDQEHGESFSGALSGNATLVLSGNDTLSFSGATNSYSGGNAINGGELLIDEDSNLGTGSSLVFNGGTLGADGTFSLGSSSARVVSVESGDCGFDVRDGYTLTVPQNISGVGAVYVDNDDSGVLVFSSGTGNSFEDGLYLYEGTLSVSQDNQLGTAGGYLEFDGGYLKITTGFTLDDTRSVVLASSTSGIVVAGGQTFTIGQGISGSGGMYFNPNSGTGTIVLEGACTYTGLTTVYGGTLTLTGSGSIADSSSVEVDAALDLSGASSAISLNTLSGDGQILGNMQALTIVQNNDRTYSGSINANVHGLIKQGSNELDLSGTNAYTTGTTIEAGTLGINTDAALGNTSGFLTVGDATLHIQGSFTLNTSRTFTLTDLNSEINVDGSETFTVNQTIADGGSPGGLTFTSNGDGILVLGGTNSYSGGTSIQTWVVSIAADDALGNTSGFVALEGGILRATTNTFSLSDTRTVTTSTSAGGIDVATGQTLTIPQAIGDGSSPGWLIVNPLSDTGTLVLGSVCTYTGSTQIDAGTLMLGMGGSIANAAATIVNGTLNLTDAAMGVTIPTLSGNSSGSIVGVSGQTLTVVQNSDQTFAGGISGITSLIKQGSGVLTFSGTNTYNTGTTIQTGTLSVSSDAALGNPETGFVDIAGGTLQITATFELDAARGVSSSSSSSTISVNNGVQFTVPQGITGSGAITLTSSGAGVLVLSGTNTFSGGLTITSGTASVEEDSGLGGSGGTVTLAGGVLQLTTNSVTLDGTRPFFTTSSSGGIDVAASKTLTIPQGISGSGNLILNPLTGTGSLVLEGSSSYTGTTTLNAGTLALTGSGAIASSAAVSVASGAILDLTGITANVSFNNLSGSGDVYTLGHQFSVNQTQDNEFDGIISGAGSFELASGGHTLTLTNANTFTGSTTINAGTMTLSGSGSIAGSSATTIASGAVLNITGISSGSATIGSLGGAGAISMSGKSIVVNQTTPSTFTGSLSGASGSFTLSGSNTLTLSGASVPYTGATNVNGGTLALVGSTSLTNSSSTTIASGATVDVSGATTSGVTLNTLAGAGDLVATGQALTINQTSNESFSGVISGNSASLTYTGGSTLTLSNTHTFTGSTTVGSGTLTLTGSGSLASSSSMTINSGGTLDASGVTLSGGAFVNTLSGAGNVHTGSTFSVVQNSPGNLSGNVSGTALFMLQGGSTLTLSGTDNTYSGGTEIQGGTLSIASDVLGNNTGTLTLAGGTLQATNTFELATERVVSTSSSSGGINVADGKSLTISQAIGDGSSNGGLTLTSSGAGTLVLGGACTYHGATTVTSGTLALSGSGALTNSESITIASGATLDISGTTSGATLNTLSGAGTLVLTGKTATVNQASDATFSGTISGTGGSLTKMGSGSLSFTGTVSYTGNTEVQAGSLVLNTTIPGSLSVLLDGTLSGVCTVGGDVTVDGTISPGNSPGPITITGNLILNSSSTTNITITPVANSELIVTGSAVLGGALIITAEPGIYLGQTQYTILTAAGFVTPAFATISGGAAGSELSISYGYDDMGNIISVILNYLTQLRDITLSGNALRFVNYLNQNSEDPALEPIFTALGILPADQLEQAAILCTPARNAIATFASQNTMFAFSRAISTHLADQRLLHSMYRKTSYQKEFLEESEFLSYFEANFHKARISSITPSGSVKKMAKQENIYSVWVDGFTEFSHQGSQNQIPSFNVASGGFLLGFDAYLYNRGEVGAAFGYAHNTVHEGQNQGSNSANLYTATIYGTAYLGRAYIETAVWGTFDQYKTERKISFPGFMGDARASFNGAQLTPHGALGYDISFDWGVIEPFVACDWVVNFEERYTEHGASPLNMSIKGSTSSMLRLEAGLNCYQTWEGDEALVIFKEMVSCVYKHPYSVGKMVAAIVGAEGTFFNDSFTAIQRLLSPSFEIFFRRKKSNAFCSILYEGEFGSSYRANEVLLRVGKYF